jgi:hypothetical protein
MKKIYVFFPPTALLLWIVLIATPSMAQDVPTTEIKPGAVAPGIFSAQEMKYLDQGEEVVKNRFYDRAIPIKIFPILEDQSLYAVDTYRKENGVISHSKPTLFQVSKQQRDVGGSIFVIYLPFALVLIMALSSLDRKNGKWEMIRFSFATAATMVAVAIVCSFLSLEKAILAGMIIMPVSGVYFGRRVLPLWGGFYGAGAGFLVGMFTGYFAGALSLMQKNASSPTFYVIWEYAFWYLAFCLIAGLLQDVARGLKIVLLIRSAARQKAKSLMPAEMAFTGGPRIEITTDLAEEAGEAEHNKKRKKKK